MNFDDTDHAVVDKKIHGEAEGEEELVFFKERAADVHVQRVGEMVPEDMKPRREQKGE